MSMIGFPLLLIPLAIYNIIVFLMPGVSFADPVLKLTLMSGAEWPVTLSDMLVALGILMLLFEVIKGARPGAKYLTDHLLSLVIFGGAAAEFLLWPKFGGSTYFLLTMLALVDFLSGIALRARRGTRAKPVPAAAARPGTRTPDVAAAPEPRFNPEPVPSVPAAAAVAESVLLDHPQPKLLHPEVAPHAPPPEVAHVPAPEVAHAPSPEVAHEPSPAVAHAPSPEVAHEPSPGVGHEPSPEVAHAPSPEVAHAPSPEVAHAPSPEVAHEPSPGVGHEPSPEVAHEPSPEVAHAPSPEVAHEPSPEVAHEPSPEVASPELQPGSSSSPSPDKPSR